MIPRVAQPRDAHEQDQRRDNRDEEQDVIEVDQEFSGRDRGLSMRPAERRYVDRLSICPMRLLMTNYLDVISSWCYWAIPGLAGIAARYGDRVDFRWKIALDGQARLSADSRAHGMVLSAQRHAHAFAGHAEAELGRARLPEYLAPNCVAEAARDFGVEDDRVWMALNRADCCDGKKIGRLGNRRGSRAQAPAGVDRANLSNAPNRRRSRPASARARRNFTRCR